MTCPCNPLLKYADCCKPIHNDILKATTPEKLMRSRYSAFVLGLGDYLQKSHYRLTKPTSKEGKETERWSQTVKWIKLEVLNSTIKPTTGRVHFKAFFLENNKVECIEENSLFIKEQGAWYYKDGL